MGLGPQGLRQLRLVLLLGKLLLPLWGDQPQRLLLRYRGLAIGIQVRLLLL